MQQHNPSFWAEIKSLEDHLSQNPDSYLFARLADVYLKVNLVDDALHTARHGVEKYPSFIAGQRVLAMACHARGLTDERRKALEVLVSALPEDLDSQKSLAGLCVACGDREAAINAYRVALEFHPENTECLEELKVLEKTSQVSLSEGFPASVEETVSESVEELSVESDEIIDLTDDDVWVEEIEITPDTVTTKLDPLSTVTLAELYVKQGFIPKALGIYRSLRDTDPSNIEILSRIAELESRDTSTEITETVNLDNITEPIISMQTSPAIISDLPSHGRADEIIITLEGWLDNIRRIRACR